MLKNILFPTDFSENAKNALPFAIDLAKKNGAKLFLIHIYETPLVPPSSIFRTRAKTMSYTEDLIVEAVNKKKQELISFPALDEVLEDFIIQEGNTLKEIQKVIRNNNIDLIVMGTLGETANREIFMGSVTKNLIQQVSCPVLAIPGDFVFRPIEHIVYTTDLKNDESNALNYLAKFTALFQARLIILHLDHNADDKPRHIQELKDITEKIDYSKIDFQDIVVEDIIKGIDTYVKSNAIDLLAITTKTTGLLDKIFHKSVTKAVLFHTHIPILAFNRKIKDVIKFE